MDGKTEGQLIDDDLETKYTIPKKQSADKEDEVTAEAPSELQSVLNDVYADPKNGAYGPWPVPGPQPYSSYAENYKKYSEKIDGMKTLKRTNDDRCKTGGYPGANVDALDPTLPKELKEQFQPLYCKLCSAQLGSTCNAKLHYSSGKHEKKVRRFLEEYSARTGEPLHKRAKTGGAKKKEDEEYVARHYHCDICDLPLTGRVHAESHYMGKNHQKVMNGKRPPVGKGYYDDEGKFVRMLPVQADLTGRNGIGVDFAPKNLDVPVQATSLRCDICSVSVTCLPQMDMHLQGQKHQKKLKLNGLAFASPSPAVDSKEIYSSFRLPSGQFYCKTCNLSLNSDSQFGAHLQSKNHAKKADRAAAAEAATAAVV